MLIHNRFAVSVVIVAGLVGGTISVASALGSSDTPTTVASASTSVAAQVIPQPQYSAADAPSALFNPKTQSVPAVGSQPTTLPAPIPPGTNVVLTGIIPMHQGPFDTATFPVSNAFRGTVNGVSELIFAGQDLANGGVPAVRVYPEASPGDTGALQGEYTVGSSPASATITGSTGTVLTLALSPAASGPIGPQTQAPATGGGSSVSFDLATDSVVGP
jgi:hypothetical protein